MKKGQIIVLITSIILILIVVLLIINIRNLNKDINENENINEANMKDNINNVNTSYINEANLLENTTDLNNELQNSENQISEDIGESIKINLIVNNKTYSATLNNTETVRELTEMFPMTIQMSDLNSNEKYKYLDSSLKTNGSIPNRINAGDIKLYRNNCLVVFYESFSNSYSYTDLGKVDNVDDFVTELGSGSVTITFEIAD